MGENSNDSGAQPKYLSERVSAVALAITALFCLLVGMFYASNSNAPPEDHRALIFTYLSGLPGVAGWWYRRKYTKERKRRSDFAGSLLSLWLLVYGFFLIFGVIGLVTWIVRTVGLA